jgi:FMN phosphatase YigB (HAD superfamily)
MIIDTTSPDLADRIVAEVEPFDPQLICFDFFDTMVTRRVHPEDVKRLACERRSRLLDPPAAGAALYTLRGDIEAELYARNLQEKGDEEFNLEELMAQLWDRLPAAHVCSKQRFVQMAMDIEVSIEASMQVVDPRLMSAVRRLRDSGLDCWLVSDFYLDTKHFLRLLDFHGLADTFTRVVISSETTATKRSGKLYQQIIADSGIAPARIVMLGDNAHSDYQSARANGLNAIHLDRSAQHQRYLELSTATNDTRRYEDEIAAAILGTPMVFREIGLTLHYFIDRLHSHLLKQGARDVFFLAREGQLLKEMFDIFQETRQLHGSTRVRSHYLEVSRRSTFLPSLDQLEHESFDTLFRQYRRISLKEFLASLGLDDLATTLASELPHDLELRHEDLPSSTPFQALLAHPRFRETYEKQRRLRRDAFGKYLGQFDLADSKNSTLHLVDVGWKGTIQDNIHGFLGRGCAALPWNAVEGHYVGLVASGRVAMGNIKHGVLFSSIDAQSKNFHVYNENRALFEVVLAADHGSAGSYEVAPEGVAHAVRQAFVEEPLFVAKIQPLQRQLITLFRTLDSIAHISTYPASRQEGFVARHHARMLLQPSDTEIRWFEDIYHVENFGVFEKSQFDAADSRPGLLARLRFYRWLRKSAGQADLGFWPWLTCLQRGGRWVASRYARAQLRNIRD